MKKIIEKSMDGLRQAVAKLLLDCSSLHKTNKEKYIWLINSYDMIIPMFYKYNITKSPELDQFKLELDEFVNQYANEELNECFPQLIKFVSQTEPIVQNLLVVDSNNGSNDLDNGFLIGSNVTSIHGDINSNSMNNSKQVSSIATINQHNNGFLTSTSSGSNNNNNNNNMNSVEILTANMTANHKILNKVDVVALEEVAKSFEKNWKGIIKNFHANSIKYFRNFLSANYVFLQMGQKLSEYNMKFLSIVRLCYKDPPFRSCLVTNQSIKYETKSYLKDQNFSAVDPYPSSTTPRSSLSTNNLMTSSSSVMSASNNPKRE